MTVLIVDDDEDDRLILSTALESVDPHLTLHQATDGRKGLDMLRKQILIEPDYIFLDLNMPVLNGFEFLTEIKKIPGLRSIPVIIYSTSSSRSDIEKGFRLGAKKFVTKPNNYNALPEILNKLIVLEEHSDQSVF